MSYDIKNKKILIVDDLIDFIPIIQKMLKSFGAWDIDSADSGEKALNMMRRKAYDIVLCDYDFGKGKKDGQQILEEVKHNGLINYSS